jgi:hypothetical protein
LAGGFQDPFLCTMDFGKNYIIAAMKWGANDAGDTAIPRFVRQPQHQVCSAKRRAPEDARRCAGPSARLIVGNAKGYPCPISRNDPATSIRKIKMLGLGVLP